MTDDSRADRAPGGIMGGRAVLAAVCFVAGLVVGVLLPIGPGVQDPAATMIPSQQATPDPASDLPVVALADLPPEAAATIELIEAGGPFPFRRDGAVFQNREGLLPQRASGHYREYTVPRLGSQGRGERRIVTGADGEMYWSPDHYDSFAWIVR